jgi:hypothetical protein
VDTQNAYWLSTNRRHLRLPAPAARLAARIGDACSKALPDRLLRETWFRYHIDISAYASGSVSTPAVLTPVTDAFIESLRRHPWRDRPQLRSAVSLWGHGLRNGYVWVENGQPLCFQWLFSHHDNERLQSLPEWSGMYPPLPPGCGQVENLLALPAGLCYPGGAATPFAKGMYVLAARRGMRQLITHIHERNLAAQYWANRTGWEAYGCIHRYQFDLPLLRRRQVYLHDVLDPSRVPSATTAISSTARSVSGGR